MGRPAGSLNKSTKQLKELAQQHTEMVIRRLANIAENSPNETNAVMASKELLDRGHGKAHQSVDVDATVRGGITVTITPDDAGVL